jgi:hypothetical protein
MPAEFEGRNRIHLDDDEENIEAIIRLPRTLYEEIKTKAESARYVQRVQTSHFYITTNNKQGTKAKWIRIS